MSAYTMNDVANQIAEATKALAVIAQYNMGVKQASAVRHAESVLNAASLMIESMEVEAKCQKLDLMIETIEEVKPLTEACEFAEVKAEASPIPVIPAEGYYREISRHVFCGPFASKQHAWDNAYANGELNHIDSMRSTSYMIDKDGKFLRVSHSKWLIEDIESAREEDKPYPFTFVSIPVPKYAELLNDAGLLKHC